MSTYLEALAEHYYKYRLTRRWLMLSGFLLSASTIPVTYHFASQFGTNPEEALTCAISSCLALICLTTNSNYGALLNFIPLKNSSALPIFPKVESSGLSAKVCLLWLTSLIGCLPMVYLNDKYVHWALDPFIAFSIATAYRFSLERFFVFLSGVFNKKPQTPENRLRQKILHALRQTLQNIGKPSLLQPLRQDIESSDEEVTVETKKRDVGSFIAGRIGNIVGAIGIIAYIFVGVETLPYFFCKYGNACNSEFAKYAAYMVAAVSYFCHGTLGGWATGLVFQKFYVSIKASKVFFSQLANNCTRKFVADGLLLGTMIFMAAASAIPRIQITYEFTDNVAIAVFAFLSVFGLSLISYQKIHEEIKLSGAPVKDKVQRYSISKVIENFGALSTADAQRVKDDVIGSAAAAMNELPHRAQPAPGVLIPARG